MLNKKRFKIGNMTVNLGTIDDALKYKPDPNCGLSIICNVRTGLGCPPFTGGGGLGCPPFTGGGGGGCGVNYSTLPPTTFLNTFKIGTQDCNATGSFGNILAADNIKDIKTSLISQLKDIEAYELELKALEAPQTLEEINMLEKEMENSLKEIQKLKKEFNQ